MQSAGIPPQQRRQESIKLPGHATERPRRNPEAPPKTTPNASRQNPPDCPGSQNLSTLHLPRVQMVPIGVRQESRRSANLPYLSLWIQGTSFLRVHQVIGIACLFLVAYLRSPEQASLLALPIC